MSAEGALHGALMTALRGDAALTSVLNGVFAGPAVKATPPFAEIGELASVDWGTKDRAGRELRIAVMLRDAAETPQRLHDLAGLAAAAIEAMPRVLPGWAVASLVPLRTRVLRGAPGTWTAVVEYRVRMLAAG